MDRGLSRRLIGLIAAYAVALNALLPVLVAALAPAAGAAAGLSVICSSGGVAPATPSGPPAKAPLCPGGTTCTMAGCATLTMPCSEPSPGYAVATNSVQVAPWPDGVGTRAPRSAGRNFARAPPLA